MCMPFFVHGYGPISTVAGRPSSLTPEPAGAMLRHMAVGHWGRTLVAGFAACLLVATGCAGHRAPLNYKTVQWESYNGSSNSPRVTVVFHSSGAARNNPCYEPRRVTAVESPTTVAVRLEMSGRQGQFSAGEGCTDMAVRDTATVTLRQPLGVRRVLDAARPTATPSRG